MDKVLTALAGKKTYIVAVVIALVNLAVAVGWISPDHLMAINSFLGALGLGALRQAVSK